MKKDSPHFWWIICILSIIIIGLVAFILTNQVLCADTIMQYISYASVILSITLSIFAILYTYTSNVQIQQQFEKINTAANNIVSTSDNLSITNNKLNDNLDVIIKHLENIDQLQQEVTTKLTDINRKVDDVDNVSNQFT